MLKKVLYIALGVQSLVLLGVVGALLYSTLRGPAPAPPEGPGAAEVATAEEAEAPVAVAPSEAASPAAHPDSGDGASAGPVSAGSQDGGASPAVPSPADGGGGGGVAEALSELVQGNERFVQGVTRTHDLIALRRAPPRPRAVVLACSDATVGPELVFDQPLGALVVVRTAAQWVDTGALAAVEDAVARERIPLVVVLGHRGCSSVKAAIADSAAGEPALAAKLRPTLGPLRQRFKGAELEAKAVEASVGEAVGQLGRGSKRLRAARPTILRAVYDEASGEVSWLDAAGSGMAKDDGTPAPGR